jgi:hypothetical protein
MEDKALAGEDAVARAKAIEFAFQRWQSAATDQRNKIEVWIENNCTAREAMAFMRMVADWRGREQKVNEAAKAKAEKPKEPNDPPPPVNKARDASERLGRRDDAREHAQERKEHARGAAEAGVGPTPRLLRRDVPRASAAAFLKDYEVDGISRLRYRAGDWHLYQDGVYRIEKEPEIKSLVSDFLSVAMVSTGEGEKPFNPKRNDYAEVLEALKFEANLKERYSPPCWLADGAAASEWIVFHNCMVNVRTGEARGHDHRLFATSALGFDYDPGAECPVYDHYMRTSLPDDEESQNAFIEWLGYSMTLETYADKGMFLFGERRSGRSTAGWLIEQLTGADTAAVNFDTWTKGEFSMHTLIGKRAILFPDVRLKLMRQGPNWVDVGGLDQISVARLLMLTGHDPFTLRKPASEDILFHGVIRGHVTVTSNKILNWNDEVLPTRWINLHWPINHEEQGTIDVQLKEKLRPELPGIAARAIAGNVRAYKRACDGRPAFIQPASGKLLDPLILEARDPHLAMIRACLEVSNSEKRSDWVIKNVAHKVCKAWLKENGKPALSALLDVKEMGGHVGRAFKHFASIPKDDWTKQDQSRNGARVWFRLDLSAEGRRILAEGRESLLD